MKMLVKTLVATAALLGASTAISPFANASPADPTYDDQYWGGVEEASGYNDNVSGAADDTFEIYGADAARVGNNLTVTIYSNYIDDYQNEPNELLGTSIGSLFIGYKGNLDYYIPDPVGANDGPPTYTSDTFSAGGGSPGDTNRFSYAFDFNTLPAAGQVNTNTLYAGSLYSLNGTGSDVELTNAAATNRNFQAFDVETAGKTAIGSGSIQFGNTGAITYGSTNEPGENRNANGTGMLTYTITNFFTNPLTAPPLNFSGPATALVLAWTMTCGNDVLLVETLVDGRIDVPLPASLLLMMTGLAGLAGLGRLRNSRPSAV